MRHCQALTMKGEGDRDAQRPEAAPLQETLAPNPDKPIRFRAQ
jgi:hypothetical protein